MRFFTISFVVNKENALLTFCLPMCLIFQLFLNTGDKNNVLLTIPSIRNIPKCLRKLGPSFWAFICAITLAQLLLSLQPIKTSLQNDLKHCVSQGAFFSLSSISVPILDIALTPVNPNLNLLLTTLFCSCGHNKRMYFSPGFYDDCCLRAFLVSLELFQMFHTQRKALIQYIP